KDFAVALATAYFVHGEGPKATVGQSLPRNVAFAREPARANAAPIGNKLVTNGQRQVRYSSGACSAVRTGAERQYRRSRSRCPCTTMLPSSVKLTASAPPKSVRTTRIPASS